MKLKQLLSLCAVASSVMLGAQIANAQSGYEITLNSALGTTGLSCSACHVGATTNATAITPIAMTWRSVGANTALLASIDSDADNFTNKEEASGTLLDFNEPLVSPFTKATGGIALTNVYVTGDNSAVEKAFTSGTAGVTVAAGSEVLGGVAVDIYTDPTTTAPITLLYKAGGAAATSTVYAVDTYANTNIQLAAADWTLQANGAVQVNQLPAGTAAGTHDLVVVRVVPVTTAPTTSSITGSDDEDGEDDDSDSSAPSAASCVSPSLTPLMMLLVMLSLGFFIRRNNK